MRHSGTSSTRLMLAALLLAPMLLVAVASDEPIAAHATSTTGHWKYNVAFGGGLNRIRAYTTKGGSNSGSHKVVYARMVTWTSSGSQYDYSEASCSQSSGGCPDQWTPNTYYWNTTRLTWQSLSCDRYTDNHTLSGINGSAWCAWSPNFLKLHYHSGNAI